ncbi:MAG: glutathione peroxidase [Parvibaculales bacterium]
MRMPQFLFGVWVMALGLALAPLMLTTSAQAELAQSRINAHQFEFMSIDGEPLSLSEYAGQTILVVNTASRCGYTNQYGDLQNLYETYQERGFVVLGVPSNDFLGQEPGTEAEIKEFCEVNFNINFPMTSKVHVRGKQAHPFYVWAKQQKGGPRWNFHKYLINSNGDLVASFSSGTKPLSSKVLQAVEAALSVNN